MMYLAHWNLREEPFQNVPDPRFAYLSEQHQEGLARLIYVAEGRRLGGVLVGPYGVGKSMVLELLAHNAAAMAGTRLMRVDVPPGGGDALARQIGRALFPQLKLTDMASALDAMRDMAESSKPSPGHVVLALDEAQLIRDRASFDFLHLLTNIRVPYAADRKEHSAFTLILVGHDDLSQTLEKEEALRQRLAMVWRLEPLSAKQVVEYVELRIRAAGGDLWMFEEDALEAVAAASGGIPRVINNICDVALMTGFVIKAPKITRQIMAQAIGETVPLVSAGEDVR